MLVLGRVSKPAPDSNCSLPKLATFLAPLLSLCRHCFRFPATCRTVGCKMWNGVRINCTTVGVAVKVNIIRNKDVYLDYMCNFMFRLSHCPAPESRNVRQVFAIANGASHIQFYHFLTDSPAWMDPWEPSKSTRWQQKWVRLLLGFSSLQYLFQVFPRVIPHPATSIWSTSIGNHQRFHEQFMASDQVHAGGQPHQAISSEHFLVNLNFRHRTLISCISVDLANEIIRCSSSAPLFWVVTFCIHTPMPTKLCLFFLRCSSPQPQKTSTPINLSSPKTNFTKKKCAHQNLGVVAPEASLPSTIQLWELELLKVFRYIFYLANPNPQLGNQSSWDMLENAKVKKVAYIFIHIVL